MGVQWQVASAEHLVVDLVDMVVECQVDVVV